MIVKIQEGMRFQHNPIEEGNEFHGDNEPIWCAVAAKLIYHLTIFAWTTTCQWWMGNGLTNQSNASSNRLSHKPKPGIPQVFFVFREPGRHSIPIRPARAKRSPWKPICWRLRVGEACEKKVIEGIAYTYIW